MPRKSRVLATLSACALLCSATAGRAETVVRADEGPVVLLLMAVDDGIACALNGREVASQSRGQGVVQRDITPDLRRGRNTLRCRIADKDGGHCFACTGSSRARPPATSGGTPAATPVARAGAARSTTTPWWSTSSPRGDPR